MDYSLKQIAISNGNGGVDKITVPSSSGKSTTEYVIGIEGIHDDYGADYLVNSSTNLKTVIDNLKQAISDNGGGSGTLEIILLNGTYTIPKGYMNHIDFDIPGFNKLILRGKGKVVIDGYTILRSSMSTIIENITIKVHSLYDPSSPLTSSTVIPIELQGGVNEFNHVNIYADGIVGPSGDTSDIPDGYYSASESLFPMSSCIIGVCSEYYSSYTQNIFRSKFTLNNCKLIWNIDESDTSNYTLCGGFIEGCGFRGMLESHGNTSTDWFGPDVIFNNSDIELNVNSINVNNQKGKQIGIVQNAQICGQILFTECSIFLKSTNDPASVTINPVILPSADLWYNLVIDKCLIVLSGYGSKFLYSAATNVVNNFSQLLNSDVYVISNRSLLLSFTHVIGNHIILTGSSSSNSNIEVPGNTIVEKNWFASYNDGIARPLYLYYNGASGTFIIIRENVLTNSSSYIEADSSNDSTNIVDENNITGSVTNTTRRYSQYRKRGANLDE